MDDLFWKIPLNTLVTMGCLANSALSVFFSIAESILVVCIAK